MTEAQIISKRKKLEKNIAKREGIHIRAIKNEEKAQEKLRKAFEALYKLRSECDHKFDAEDAPTMMGRGKCELCGENDY